MANEIGNTLLNSITNSTFDVGNMSKVLAEAEVAGPRAILDKNTQKVTTELDALKYLQTNLNAFNTYVADLSSPDVFQMLNATSSNDNIVSVTAESGAALGSYQIESRKMAQAHTLVFDNLFTSTADTISTGTLSFNVGGQVNQIAIGTTNNTLDALQKYINNGDFGVSASVLNTGSGYQLMLTSDKSGASGEITFGAGNPAEFSAYTTTAVAQDAEMVLNGLTLTSNTNTFDKVIEGVTFQLKSAAVGTVNSVSIASSTEKADEAIRSFVDVYNQLDTIIDELGSYKSSDLTEEQLQSDEYMYFGDLAGSSLLRQVRDQVKSAMSGAIDELNGGVNSLAQIGISFDREGRLNIDETVYTAALENNLQAVSSLFSKGGTAEDNFINFLSATDKTQAGAYEIFIDQLASRAQWTMAAPDSDGLDGDVDIAGNGGFTISVDGSSEVSLSIADGEYTMTEFAKKLADTINNSTEIAAAGASVTVSADGGNFVIYSNRYGTGSSLNLTGFANIGDSALTTGKNVDGTIRTDQGDLNLGAYADSKDGRKINISDYAVINGEAADVRGLSFEVTGGLADGSSRGDLTYAKGFASRLQETINNFFEKDNGLISQKIEGLNTKLDSYDEKSKTIDARYERLLMKYQLQFSALQSLLSSSQQTRDYLTATFNNNNNN
ncbi:MAG: flagellar filament capping protein FliD [Thiotrichales bacterium]|nr:flagellar filament capping protein FliD [Thiotrichales bacterium]